MSLLNDMLRDLSQQKPSSKPDLFFAIAPVENISLLLKYIGFMCIICIMCLGLYLNYKYQNNISTIHQTNSTTESREAALGDSIKAHIEQLFEQKQAELASAIAKVPEQPRTNSASHEELQLKAPVLSDNILDRKNATEENLPSSDNIKINKVYSPQNLKEWHTAKLNLAHKHIEQGEDEQAIVILQDIIAKVPESHHARANLASLYLTYGDIPGAVSLVDEGLRYRNRDPSLLTIKARVYLEQSRAHDAILLLSQNQPDMHQYPDYYATLAAAMQYDNHISESSKIYKDLLQIDSHNSQYWLGYAIALEHNHEIQQAVDAYNRASQNADAEDSVRIYASSRLKSLQGTA